MSKKEIKITFSPEGEAISDFMVKEYAEVYLREMGEIHVSTFNVITEVRCLISEGFYSHEDIVVYFEMYRFQFDENGKLDEWVSGFGDLMDEQLSRLLKL